MAQNSPKLKKYGHFSVLMPIDSVTQKTLSTYIPVKTYLEKSRYPKWPLFGENFGKKWYFLYIMYVKA